MYKISMIVPIYNGEKYLGRAVDSIINQSIGFENIELILINDCSKDNSKEIILEYAKKYDNIVPINLEKNSGCAGIPRNIGLSKATSNFIMFLDVDDYYTPEACEKLYDTILSEKSDIVVANYYLNSNENIMENNLCPKKYKNLISINPTEKQSNFEKITNMTFMAPWSKIFTKEIIKDNNITFSKDTQFDDAQFYFENLLKAKKVTILPDSHLYYYNEYGDSIMHKHDVKLFNSFFRGFKEINKLLCNDDNVSNIGFLNEHLQSLLLIFTNTKLPKQERIKLLEEIHDFEKEYDNIKIKNKEINVLNNAILDKKYNLAIFISDVYSFGYNNSFLKNIYRKVNNFRRTK